MKNTKVKSKIIRITYHRFQGRDICFQRLFQFEPPIFHYGGVCTFESKSHAETIRPHCVRTN